MFFDSYHYFCSHCFVRWLKHFFLSQRLADIDDKKMISDYLWSILPKFVCRGEKSYELFALLAYATANIGMVNADKVTNKVFIP